MATAVIMPALGMAQETGLLVRWLKQAGEAVNKGDPLMEVETDKATVEIEAPASGQLGGVQAREGDTVPVGNTIAWVLNPGETPPPAEPASPPKEAAQVKVPQKTAAPLEASVVARNIAAEQGIDLSQVRSHGKRIEKADVLAYMQEKSAATGISSALAHPDGTRLLPASPKARRLANEADLPLNEIRGSGPDGAVLTADVLAAQEIQRSSAIAEAVPKKEEAGTSAGVGTIWRLMAEHTTAAWTSTPHFYLMREVQATRLVQWRDEVAREVEEQAGIKLTYTDLLVKLLAVSLKKHPLLTSTWENGAIHSHDEINIGLAVAVEDGLVAPVIHSADRLSLSELARRRKDLVDRSLGRKLRPADLEGGTFTFTNLGMYNVDAFYAIINSPQAAILAVGRIADRVIAVDGQAAVRPTIILSLSCDHRLVDGARGAQFLDELSKSIENPWRLMI